MPSRQRSYRLEGVVLRHSDWGEADRLLTVFTREMGKLRLVAKGVRKLRSRKAGHLEPFTQVSLQVSHGRDLPIVTQAETVNAYLPLKEDLLLLGYASYVVELLDRFTYEEGEHVALYRRCWQRRSSGWMMKPIQLLRCATTRCACSIWWESTLFKFKGQEKF